MGLHSGFSKITMIVVIAALCCISHCSRTTNMLTIFRRQVLLEQEVVEQVQERLPWSAY